MSDKMAPNQIADLANAFFDAAERGDIEAVGACLKDDAIFWHNIDETEKSKTVSLQGLAGSFQRLTDRHYADRRLNVFPGGFVQQYNLKARRRDGSSISMPAAVVCYVDEGKIQRLDEYLDTPRVAEARQVFDPESTRS